MSADVIHFPVLSARTLQHEEPMAVVCDALCRMNLLMAAYLHPGERYDAEFILMKINEILREPSLYEATAHRR
jgi:hypothetical protein